MIKYMVLLIKKYCLKLIDMDILTLGWVGVLSLFTWSIAMVVWGRKGF
jgi:cytochrome b6-f complex subunit 8